MCVCACVCVHVSCRDNILVSTDAEQRDRAALIERLRAVPKACWTLEVECACISKEVHKCTGLCCGPVTKAVGVVLVLPGGGESTAFAEPAALTPEWDL